MPSMTTSKKLHYKKLMVPSQHEDGKFEIETNPDNLVSLISSENATPSMESQKISQNLESAKPLSSTSANTGTLHDYKSRCYEENSLAFIE